jgi:hypothetical protein
MSDAQLNALRKVGDVALGDVNQADGTRPAKRPPNNDYFAAVATKGVVDALKKDAETWTEMQNRGTAAFESWRATVPERFSIDTSDLPGVLQDGRRLFDAHGEEIAAALLLAGLPELYATQWGAPVLVAHGDLVWHVQRRVRQTAQFLVDVLSREPLDDRGQEGIQRLTESALAVRYFHHQLRLYFEDNEAGLGERNMAPHWPLNQEDLLGTLLTFTVTVFRVFSAFGIELSADQQQAYLLLWDLVGELMGIGDDAAAAAAETAANANGAGAADPEEAEANAEDEGDPDPAPADEPQALAKVVVPTPLRPSSPADAKCLLDRLHARQWIRITGILDDDHHADHVLPSDPLNPGRILARALLEGLTESMPPRRRQVPLNAMRALATGEVRSRLGLTGGGVFDYLWNRLPARRWHSAPWTSTTTPNRVGATVLRFAATDVSRHAVLAFLKAPGPPFVFPNLDFGQLGPPSSGPADRSDYLGIRGGR